MEDNRRNYKHIPQIVCMSSRFRVLHLLSWDFEAIWSPLKICCYTCMSFETRWSRLIYTKLSSHLSFVIHMYVVTMAWRCISPWSFHRSPQRRREMDIFRYISRFPRILSKNNQKRKKKTSIERSLTLTFNLRAEIATCRRQYHM